MHDDRPSETALAAAALRAAHRLYDEDPIFDDALAEELTSATWREHLRTGAMRDLVEELGLRRIQGQLVGRMRYLEDALEEAVTEGIGQYVLLGAGLDAFAWRRPELRERLHVIELDHPATQGYKKERLAELGRPIPDRVELVCVDFESTSIEAALEATAYDRSQRAFFSWMGVVGYLSRDAFESAIRDIASVAAPGSLLLFDYPIAPELVREEDASLVQLVDRGTADLGETRKLKQHPEDVRATLERVGFERIEDLSPTAFSERYFAVRRDGLAPNPEVHLTLLRRTGSGDSAEKTSTSPTTESHRSAKPSDGSDRLRSRRLRIGGDEDPLETLHRRGLTDGLPVVLPTPERVLAMLHHTSHDPQEVVGILPPYMHPATVEKVAINAVMAGCPEPALPVVLAALDAIGEASFSLQGVIATTNPVGPLLVVSGPPAEALEINSGGNCLGQGARANLGIGRALQLTLRNVGGGVPGRDDRATLGQMGKLSACFAERISDSPWESLSVERGLSPDDTGVTVFAAEGPRVIPDAISRTPESLAASFAMAVDALYHPKQRGLLSPLLVVPPSCARVFGEAGWSKQQLKQAIFERSKRPVADLLPGARGCEIGADPALLERDDGSGIAKVPSPDDITIVHAGGDVGSMAMLMAVFPANERGSIPATRCVEDWQ
jgi:methyltransferase (TIGR00027 family)